MQMGGPNKKRVEEIFKWNKLEKWPYPKIFDVLKEAGTVRYLGRTDQAYVEKVPQF